MCAVYGGCRRGATRQGRGSGRPGRARASASPSIDWLAQKVAANQLRSRSLGKPRRAGWSGGEAARRQSVVSSAT